MNATTPIGHARERIISAGMALASAVADAALTGTTPIDPATLKEFRDADDALRSLTRHTGALQARPLRTTEDVIATVAVHDADTAVRVAVSSGAPSIILTAPARSSLGSDEARALAAALTTAADRIDEPRPIRRSAAVSAALLNLEG